MRHTFTLCTFTSLKSFAMALVLFTAGCKRPEPQPMATSQPNPSAVESGASTSTPASAQNLPNPYLDAQPKLPNHLAMQLPQPLLEPTEAQDPRQYVPANPPWPAALTPIYGSELVARVKTSGKRGVLINVWASWCGPCKVEMPMLLELRETYLERGIDVWFVSVNQSSEAEQVLAVLNERKVPMPHYVAKGVIGYFVDALSPVWRGSLPSTFLYDGDGKLRYYWGAQVFEEEITPLLEEFLAGKPIDGVANVQVRKGTPAPGQK